MIERLKRKLRNNDDHGSSFVLVIVATTFMCILASAILMGAMMTYKLKFYKLNSLNNFYEVETALDEMYAGVGAATNEHLYSAYTTTAELVVVYDTKAQAYTTLDNKSANELFKKLFMTGFVADTNYKSLKNVTDTLQSFISNEYDAVDNPDGVRLDTSNMKLIYTDVNNKTTTQYYKNNGGIKTEKQSGYENDKVQSVTFKNVCVKRSVDLQGSTAGTYEQSITTDIVLTEPEYNVSFDTSSVSNNTLYEYAILADMGVEVGEDNDNRTTDAQVKGNIYAASDYYNKDYNDVVETKVTNKYESKPSTMWGTKDSSAYSGIFVNGKNTSLTLNSDVVVCSGSLAAYNGAEINLSGRTQTLSELWADNIVIGGKDGGSLKASADAYIFDDTELNAEKASLKFTQGSYFGYSYNAQDTRSLNYLRQKGYLATGYKLRSHFSDSAIIVNGKNSTLDLQELNSLYIAGKSYIEFSKIAASSVSEDDENITVDENADYAFTTLEDYSTGQSLDVKTNQLMFLTQWSVIDGTENVDPDTGITTVTLRLPKNLDPDVNSVTDRIKLYDDFITDLENLGEKGVTAIKQTVSGHDYYYLYIEDGKDSSNVSNAEKFAEKYYDFLDENGDDIVDSFYNVKKYEQFQVKLVLPSQDKMNANGAITDQKNDDSLFLRSSTDTTMDVTTALDNVSTGKVFTNILGNKGSDNNKKAFNDLKADALKLAGSGTASVEEQTSTFLSYMYINMKDHLSVLNNVDDKTKRTQNAWEIANYTSSSVGYLSSYDKDRDTYSYDYSITPLNHYVDFAYVFSKNLSIEKTIGNATGNEAKTIVINSGDVKLQPNNGDGSFQGIIIAGGNVRFDENVKSFRGMIITGSKLIIDHNMSISADAAFVANLLEQCSESTDEKLNTLTTKVLKNYTSSKSEGNTEVTGASISDISYEDILVFQNWKKNVE
jgi:hypothetical protein